MKIQSFQTAWRKAIKQQKVLFICAFLGLGCLWTGTARADMTAIIIDENGLPFDLSPSNYTNSPANYDNSPENYDNSDANYDNSPANYNNSPANYENGINGKQRIISEDNEFLGYYVFTSNNRMNLFDASGNRIGYIPGGGHTNSVFSESGWCGTLGENNGQTVLGFTKDCYRQFFLDR